MTADIVVAQPADPVPLNLVGADSAQQLLSNFHELSPVVVVQELEDRVELELAPGEDAANGAVALGRERERRCALVDAPTAKHLLLAHKAINQPYSARMRESDRRASASIVMPAPWPLIATSASAALPVAPARARRSPIATPIRREEWGIDRGSRGDGAADP